MCGEGQVTVGTRGVTAGQEGVGGSEMTGELVYRKGREQIENVALE